MPIKSFRPITPSRRFLTQIDFSDLLDKKPEKRLIENKPSTGGRNNYGRITSRFRGGGHKRNYRIIDFKRNKYNIPGKVVGLEYDPNRSARIALINYADGEKRYILAPAGIKSGDTILSSEAADIQVGNSLPLKKIPPGTNIHNIEFMYFDNEIIPEIQHLDQDFNFDNLLLAFLNILIYQKLSK